MDDAFSSSDAHASNTYDAPPSYQVPDHSPAPSDVGEFLCAMLQAWFGAGDYEGDREADDGRNVSQVEVFPMSRGAPAKRRNTHTRPAAQHVVLLMHLPARTAVCNAVSRFQHTEQRVAWH